MLPTSVSQVLEQIVNAIVSVVASYYMVRNYSASENVAAYGAAGGTMGTLFGAFFGLLFLMFTYMIYRPIIMKQIKKDKTPYRESYRNVFKLILFTSFPVILSQVVYQLSSTIDSSLFNHLMDDKVVTSFFGSIYSNFKEGMNYDDDIRNILTGIYSNKYITLANVPISIASAMAASIVPSISGSVASGHMDEVRGKVHAAVKFNMIIAIPSAVGMGVLASPILQLLFGDGRALPGYILAVGSISIVFFALSTVTSGVLQGINKMSVPVYHAAIALVLHVILVVILLECTSLSIFALVIGNVTFALTISILNWLSVAKHLNYQQEVLKTFLLPFVSAAIMGVVTYFTYKGIHFITNRNSVSCIVSIVVAILVYGVLLIFLKAVDEEEISRMPKGHLLVKMFRKVHLL